MKVQNINSNLTSRMEDFATKKGMGFATIPLNDGSSANIFSKRNSIDCYLVKSNKIVAAKGFHGNFDFIFNELYELTQKLLKKVPPNSGFDLQEFALRVANRLR